MWTVDCCLRQCILASALKAYAKRENKSFDMKNLAKPLSKFTRSGLSPPLMQYWTRSGDSGSCCYIRVYATHLTVTS